MSGLREIAHKSSASRNVIFWTQRWGKLRGVAGPHQIWQGHALFDAETDHLMPTPKMAAAMTFHHPPPLVKSKLPKFTAGPPGPAPSLVAAPKPRPKRAGWVE